MHSYSHDRAALTRVLREGYLSLLEILIPACLFNGFRTAAEVTEEGPPAGEGQAMTWHLWHGHGDTYANRYLSGKFNPSA